MVRFLDRRRVEGISVRQAAGLLEHAPAVEDHDPGRLLARLVAALLAFDEAGAEAAFAAAEVAALRVEVAAHLDRVGEVLNPAAAERVVGVAGTVTTVTAIALGLEAYDPRRIHLATVDAAQVAAAAAKLATMTVAERAALPVMARGREDVIAAGALLLDELVATFRIPRVIASEADILDGVLLGLAGRADGG